MSWTKPSSEEILARAAASAETLRAIYEGASSGSDSETEDDEDDEDLSKLEELILKRTHKQLAEIQAKRATLQHNAPAARSSLRDIVGSQIHANIEHQQPTSGEAARKRARIDMSLNETSTNTIDYSCNTSANAQPSLLEVRENATKASLYNISKPSVTDTSVSSSDGGTKDTGNASKKRGKQKAAKPAVAPWTLKDFAKRFSTPPIFARHLATSPPADLQFLQYFKPPAPLSGVRALFVTPEKSLVKQMAILMANVVRMGGQIQDALLLPSLPSKDIVVNANQADAIQHTTHVILYWSDSFPEPKFRDVLRLLALENEEDLVGAETAAGTSGANRPVWVVKKSWVIECAKQPALTGTARKVAEMAHLVQCEGDKKRKKSAMLRNASRSTASIGTVMSRDVELVNFQMPGESQESTPQNESDKMPTNSQLLRLHLPASNETPMSFEDIAVEVDMARGGLDTLLEDDDDDDERSQADGHAQGVTEEGDVDSLYNATGKVDYVLPSLRPDPIDSDDCPTDEEAAFLEQQEKDKQSATAAFKQQKRVSGSKYRCDSSNAMGAQREGPNEHVAVVFDQLAAYYEKSKLQGAWWRVKGYRTAAGALRNVGRKIDTLEDARKLHGIGEKTAVKLMEIIQTGKSTHLEAKTEKDRVEALLTGIYGVGPSRAAEMYHAGVRTLQDCETAQRFGITLTPAQKLGLQYYEDLQERMLRSEVERHFKRIKNAAVSIDPYLIVECMGSFRRGQSDCGDIDILVTRDTTTDGKDHSGLVQRLVETLFSQGVIRYTLSNPDDWRSLDAKWMGLLVGLGGKMRRIDILGVPFDELGAALIYFTGNDIFNRSLRLKARHLGYSLNQRGLFKDVWRDKQTGEKKTAGSRIASRTEEEIFAALGTKWRPPNERLP